MTRRVECIDPSERTVRLDGGDVLRTRAIVLAMGRNGGASRSIPSTASSAPGSTSGATDTLPASTAASSRAPMHSIFPKRLWRSRLNCYRHPID